MPGALEPAVQAGDAAVVVVVEAAAEEVDSAADVGFAVESPGGSVKGHEQVGPGTWETVQLPIWHVSGPQ